MKKTLLVLSVVLLSAGLTLAAQTTGTAAAAKGEPHSDKAFLEKAAIGGLLEVKLGQLAVQNAASQEVKSFGQRMIDDHTKANQELAQLAQAKGVTVATELGKHHKMTVDKLSKETGEKFDKAYMKDMVRDHEKDVKEFEHEAKNGKDPDVKAFAEKTLAVLQQHLDQAKNVAQTVKATEQGTKSEKPGAVHKTTR